MDWDHFENALEWYGSAPARWYQSGKKDMDAAAEWILNVIEGDFADEQSTAQVVTGTVISLIPGVDQLCDVRDLVANCKKIHEDVSNKWAWVALPLTLIGLFPELGSLAKGGGKIMFAYGRKSVLRVGADVLDSGFWKASKPFVEAGIGKLNQYLQMPMVRKTLKNLRIYNPYHFLSGKAAALAGHVNLHALLAAFDKVLDVLRSLVAKIQHWGSAAMGTRAGRMLQVVIDIRNKANQALKSVLAPVTQWLQKLARRLELQGDMNYRAIVNSTNPHHFTRVTLQEEEAHFLKAKPTWVDDTGKLPHRALINSPARKGWPDISKTSKIPTLRRKFDTFHDAMPVVIPPGEKIYRVLDPGSFDDSICWMREAEFKALNSKSEWRRKFAVWGNWNRNGEYVTYVVPPGAGLKVWEGPTSSQAMTKGSKFTLEGGASQLVVDPADLSVEALGKRQPTGWGYSDFAGESDTRLGLPTLTNNLYSMQKTN